jgi:hypothetical protein
MFRRHLGAADVKRPELTEKSDVRQPIRAHDLRATFVTVALANGRTEAFIADRTGHRSSAMINRYRRTARTHGELGQGTLAPLDVALGLLSDDLLGGGSEGPRVPHQCPTTVSTGELSGALDRENASDARTPEKGAAPSRRSNPLGDAVLYT